MSELPIGLDLTGSATLDSLILFAGFAVAAKLADLIITRVVRRLAGLTRTELDDKLINTLHRPVFFTVLLVGAAISVRGLSLSEDTFFHVRASLYTILAVIWAIAAIRASNLIIEHVLLRMADVTGLGRDVIPMVENVWKVIVVGATIMIALTVWKVNITPLLASAGIAGFAFALAAKDTLANFFGGISIFIDRPYTLGDYIVLEGGERGEVTEIGIRSTRIKTRDDILISVPNSIIANSKIINESAPVPRYRVRISVGVSYGSDIEEVERQLLEISTGNENVLGEPEPRVRFRQFGDSALIFELLCWIKEPALRGLTIHELNSTIYKSFSSSGIKIPFPQRDVHIYEQRQSEGA